MSQFEVGNTVEMTGLSKGKRFAGAVKRYGFNDENTTRSLSAEVYSMKREVRKLLNQRQLEAIAELAARKRRVLGSLLSLTFDADPQIGWRAVEGMGVAAARIADADPGPVREHLRRLVWLLNEESGGICWRAPEAIAEIICQRPALFANYVPIVIHLLLEMAEEDLRHFRPGILWAIGRLGENGETYVPEVLPAIVAALDHADSQVRGMSVWCLDRLGRTELLAGRSDLLGDDGPVDLYEDGVLTRTSVGQLSQRAFCEEKNRG